MTVQKTKIRKTFNYLIRAIIIVVTYGFIYRQVFVERKLQDFPGLFSRLTEKENTYWFLALIFGMMLINWSIESIKWKLLIKKIEKISFFRAFMAVMTGISVSIFMPNRTGDYLGRVFILEKGNHLEGILITIIGSLAQIVVTISIGLFCFLTFIDKYIRVSYQVQEYLFSGLILLIPLLVFIILLFYFNISLLSDFIIRYMPGKWDRFRTYAQVFKNYNSKELLKVLLLSLLRYVIFSTQFFLLIRIFGADLPLGHAMILIPVIYLVMAIIPSVALTELGVRGSVSIFVIGLYFTRFGIGDNGTEMAILASSSVLWLINLIIPAIFGTFFVFSLKFFRK